MADGADRRQQIKDQANALAKGLDADLLLFNYEIWPQADWFFISTVARRKSRRRNVVLILVTEGGLADSAFRMMRILQSSYERITVVVPGWCKSAGTLMCIGGHELQIGAMGELGPLDVQIVKADELDEQKSGVVVEVAFEKLRQEAFKYFMGFVRDLAASEYRVTLKTAFDISLQMTTGVMKPIFDKLDPVTIGEDYRSNRLAMSYAERLNLHSKNLKRSAEFDALETLLSGYESHGFVIDFKEASNLFRNVQPISDEITELMDAVGVDCFFPRNQRQGQEPQVEYFNDEPEQAKGQRVPSGSSADSEGATLRGRSRKLRGASKAGSRATAHGRNGAEKGSAD